MLRALKDLNVKMDDFELPESDDAGKQTDNSTATTGRDSQGRNYPSKTRGFMRTEKQTASGECMQAPQMIGMVASPSSLFRVALLFSPFFAACKAFFPSV